MVKLPGMIGLLDLLDRSNLKVQHYNYSFKVVCSDFKFSLLTFFRAYSMKKTCTNLNSNYTKCVTSGPHICSIQFVSK